MTQLQPINLPVPEDPLLRIRRLARDLAYGVLHGTWDPYLQVSPGENQDDWDRAKGQENPLQTYMVATWQGQSPRAHLLRALGYLHLEESDRFHAYYTLTPKAYELLDTPLHASIFISYHRRESSAFALLLLARLKAAGLDAFLDLKDLTPGDDWHSRLEQEIKTRQHFICLIGPASLESPYVREEIQWALDGNRRTIPVCHGGFRPEQNRYPELDPFLKRNAILVENENARAYNNAVLELLNYFGFTPE